MPCKLGTRGWGFSETAIQKLFDEDKILFGSDETTVPQLKNYLVDNEYQLPKSNVFFDSQSSTKWIKAQGFNFSFPKALEYISYIISIFPYKKATILDFFAGSGTTLHATMALNAEDGGNRKCILVTNNENNICEEVTYERNKRVIHGYTNAKGVAVAGLRNNNLRYYKCDPATFVKSNKSEHNRRELTRTSTALLCIKEDIYHSITNEAGFDENQCTVFTNRNGRYMIVVYYNRKPMPVYEQIIKFIKGVQDAKELIKVYAFSPEMETIVGDLIEVADKIEAVPLPDAIFNAFRATFRVLKLDKKPLKTTENKTITETDN